MAFKLSKEILEAKISFVEYKMLSDRVTCCLITLKNGFQVSGTSAVLHMENFNKAKGESVAYDNAFDQLWALEGYLYMQQLYEAGQAALLAKKSLSFSDAFKALRNGYRIKRAGWNGKNQWVTMNGLGGMLMLATAEEFWCNHIQKHIAAVGGRGVVRPALVLKAEDGTIQLGWVPSTGDLFADDWSVLPN